MTKPVCKSCVYWERDGEEPGKMPGVRPGYRKCTLPSLERKLTRYTHPEGMCQHFTERKEETQPNLGEGDEPFGTPV